MSLLFLCLKIFFARIIDVSLGTIRTVFSVKGRTIVSGLIAFFEVIIWFLVVKEALNTEYNNIIIPISYAAGYATGTIIGTYISKNFINSLISVEIMTNKATQKNLSILHKEGFAVSKVNAIKTYQNTKSSILFMTINSRYLNHLKELLTQIDENAFIVINESKIVHNGFIK